MNTPITAALQHTFPDAGQIEPLRVLGEGFSSMAVETASDIVFRIAKNAPAGAAYKREAQFLPALHGRVPVATPLPQWYVEQSVDFPFGVIGYRKLHGHTSDDPPANLQPLIAGVADFLRTLHQFPPQDARGLEQKRPDYAQLYADVLPHLKENFSPDDYNRLAAWWDAFLHDSAMTTDRPTVIHGDFWYGNWVMDEALTGVLDFENAAIGDPAQDFATLAYLGADFVEQVIQLYRSGGDFDDGIPYRAKRLLEVREFGGLQYAIRYHNAEEYADSLEKIRHSAIFR